MKAKQSKMLAVLKLIADCIVTCPDCEGTGKENENDACRYCGGLTEVFTQGASSYIEDVRRAIAKAEGRSFN